MVKWLDKCYFLLGHICYSQKPTHSENSLIFSPSENLNFLLILLSSNSQIFQTFVWLCVKKWELWKDKKSNFHTFTWRVCQKHKKIKVWWLPNPGRICLQTFGWYFLVQMSISKNLPWPPYIIVFYCFVKLEIFKIGKNINLKFCFLQIRKWSNG